MNQGREMSNEPIPIWRRIGVCCWSILGYCAVLGKVGQASRPSPEHETRSLPRAAEKGGSDHIVIDIKPVVFELSKEIRTVEGRDTRSLGGESRVSESLTELDEPWI